MYINIIGYGYVGGSLGYLCKNRDIEFSVTDTRKIDAVRYFSNLEDTIRASEKDNRVNYYFICVPTPSVIDNYRCDISIVESVLSTLTKHCTKKTVVILKSTVTPGTCRRLADSVAVCGDRVVSLFFCPEFLTERNALNDVINETKVIVGCKDLQTAEFPEIIYKMYTAQPRLCLYEEAELMKYTINTFLARKVSFFNDIYDVCQEMGVNYNNVKELITMDGRIGKSHVDVPGPDGKYGYGGTCFPKEMKGMYSLMSPIVESDEYFQIMKKNETRRLRTCKFPEIYEYIYSYGIFPQHEYHVGDMTIYMDKNDEIYKIRTTWGEFFHYREMYFKKDETMYILTYTGKTLELEQVQLKK